MISTLKFIVQHPLNRRRPLSALGRYAAWQVGSRLVQEHTHSWISGTKLSVRNGMTGATGNIYCGLHEYADMSLVLHLLRPGDIFLDIGANIGSYTVLASGVCGARSVAFEPDPITAGRLRRNVRINGLEPLVTVHETALGAYNGESSFTIGLDTVNQVAKNGDGDGATRRVQMRRLDEIADADQATFIKLDVEGYEAEVLAGARAVLASPSLLGLETEAQDLGVVQVIENAGFRRRYYDPATRALQETPVSGLQSSNALFVRNADAMQSRLQQAPRRRINGQMI